MSGAARTGKQPDDYGNGSLKIFSITKLITKQLTKGSHDSEEQMRDMRHSDR